MKEFRKYIFVFLSVLFFVLAAFQEHQTLNKHPEARLIQSFRKKWLEQDAKLNERLKHAEKILNDSLTSENYISAFAQFSRISDDDGLGILIYKGSKMVYWSSNRFAFPNLQNKFSTQNQLLTLPNGIYTAKKRIVGNHELIGLVSIRNNYSYENQFLENTFVEPFFLPADFKIVAEKELNGIEISDENNRYLFSVLPSGTHMHNMAQLIIPSILYLFGFLFLLLSIYQRIKIYRKRPFGLKMMIVFIVLAGLYAIHIMFGIPVVLKHLSVFSAQYYAISGWLPSLGDFFLITVLFFFLSLVFVREISSFKGLKNRAIISWFIVVLLLYQLVGLMIGNLIRNSNIVYKLNRITDIDLYSISAYLAIALLLISVFLVHQKIIERTAPLIRKNQFLSFHWIAVPVAIVLCFVFPCVEVYLLTLFLLVNLVQSQVGKMHISINSPSYSILFISLFSVFSLLVVYHTLKKRDIEVQKLLAINISSEQDPVAEVFLAQMQNKLSTDSVIETLLTPPYTELENYLTRTYFSGYFRKYDIQYTFCTANDSVLIRPENTSEICFPFFEKMIKNSGNAIPGSSFYLMNNTSGRVSYLGKLHYPLVRDPNGVSVFIELNSKVMSEGIGFPELLMDRSLLKPFRYKYLSYAKYFDDERVNRYGDYTYNYYLQSYNIKNQNQEFQQLKWDGYNHLIYRADDKNQIIVSYRALTFTDYLISFPYIFVFYFVFALAIGLMGNARFRKLIIPNDLRFRIQGAIISVVLFSLLFVASGTIYYNIKEYQDRHQYDLQEKIKSISEEIKDRLINANAITPLMQQWLYDDLYRLSNIFRADINIYDVNGELLATSRPEIFAKGVTSERMNSKAFYELSERYQLNYFQPEMIGKLSYLSAYEPIINNKGDYLGYLNLPYFTREDELKQSISTFIVAFINLYLLLFLASVIAAVVLSNRITQPLSLIREKLRGIQLGKKNEQISYQAEDEIGALVQEYNHKVDELAESAELLARSERETAWREMAKQVAHEIKNPLTPMKLNIQYLQRAKEEGIDHYDDFFNRVTKNLIEQIDTLSGIATEFSNFAQIPKTKNEVFNLIEVLKNVCALFEPNQNLHFTLELNHLSEIMIFADKEQLSRAFLNLIKNGIQAIPTEQKGEINIRVEKNEFVVLVAIRDNGTGISQEVQDRLFEPNFTTKTSGMGLGLSIVRNIITNSKGKIRYETSENSGTTFFIEIPLYQPGKLTE